MAFRIGVFHGDDWLWRLCRTAIWARDLAGLLIGGTLFAAAVYAILVTITVLGQP